MAPWRWWADPSKKKSSDSGKGVVRHDAFCTDRFVGLQVQSIDGNVNLSPPNIFDGLSIDHWVLCAGKQMNGYEFDVILWTQLGVNAGLDCVDQSEKHAESLSSDRMYATSAMEIEMDTSSQDLKDHRQEQEVTNSLILDLAIICVLCLLLLAWLNLSRKFIVKSWVTQFLTELSAAIPSGVGDSFFQVSIIWKSHLNKRRMRVISQGIFPPIVFMAKMC